MTFDDDELDRYARHIVLPEIGAAGQARLKAARVVIVGAGGIGCPAIQSLAAAGVGTLLVIDDDRVETSNLQRQVLFGTGDVGLAKVDAAARAVARLNRHVVVEGHRTRIDGGNAAGLLAGADVVVDGCDNFATRLAVSDASVALRVPLVSAAVGRFEGQLATYRGWEGPCYRCLVGDAPERADISCADDGVLGALTGVMGSMAALEAMRVLTGFGDDGAGRLLLYDALSLRVRTVRLAKDPACRCAA